MLITFLSLCYNVCIIQKTKGERIIMKNKKLLAAALVGTAVLVGCSPKEEAPVTPEVETPVVEETEAPEIEVIETFTGVATATSPIEGTNDVIKVDVTFEGGNPVDVAIDVELEDGTLKSELSKSGEYVMTEEGLAWHEQIELMQDQLKANAFDIAAIELTEDGKTDAITGVSISVSDYVTVIEQLIADVQAGLYTVPELDVEEVDNEATVEESEDTELVTEDATTEGSLEADESEEVAE